MGLHKFGVRETVDEIRGNQLTGQEMEVIKEFERLAREKNLDPDTLIEKLAAMKKLL